MQFISASDTRSSLNKASANFLRQSTKTVILLSHQQHDNQTGSGNKQLNERVDLRTLHQG